MTTTRLTLTQLQKALPAAHHAFSGRYADRIPELTVANDSGAWLSVSRVVVSGRFLYLVRPVANVVSLTAK